MKIAWFTPFNPHSAIGDYSEAVVAELAKADEVVLYSADEPRPSAPGVPRVVRLDDQPDAGLLRELDRFDLLVYNMGDHYYYHKKVYEVLLQRPGVVVLHDLVMRDFFRGYHLAERHDPQGLARLLSYSEGQEAAEMAQAVWMDCWSEVMDDPLRLQFPMFKPALRRCLGVVVHSDYTRARVAAAVAAPVVLLDFPPFGPCAAHARQAPPRKRPHSGKVRLLTFGVLNSNKLIHQVIESIGRSAYLRANATYTVVGAEGEAGYVKQLQEAVERLGLTGVVDLAGRLSDDELWEQLTQADVVVNLRNPHFGESSGSLLNALLAGAAILVWDHGCYAEFPDNVVYKVSAKADISRALERLGRDRALRERLGKQARRHAEERFDAAVFCRRFRDFTEVVRSSRPVLALTDLLSDRLLEFGPRPPDGLPERLAAEVAAMAGGPAPVR